MHVCSSTWCRYLRPWAVSLAILLPFETAFATGFFVNQQSVRGLGRTDAGNSTAADELGTIYFNAAGLTQLDKGSDHKDWHVSYATNVIVSRGEINNTGSTAASPGTLGAFAAYGGGNAKDPGPPAPVPNIYLARSVSDRAAIGAAVNVPFGLSTSPGSSWFGRYDAMRARLTTINVSLVGAYELIPDQLSLGGGVDVQYAESRLVNAIPNPIAPGGPTAATDARADAIGHAWTPGFNVGLLYSFNQGRTRLGAHFRSSMTHTLEGSLTVQGFNGALTPFNGTTGTKADLNLPAIATFGLWHHISDVIVMADFGWYGWSTLDEVRIHLANGQPDLVRPSHYRDAYALSLGIEYPRPWPEFPLSLRGGIHFDTTPTVDAYRDTTFPDSDRLWLGVGATYNFSDRWSADFAFNHVFFRDTTVAITREFFNTPLTPQLATSVRMTATVRAVVDTIAFAIHYRF